VAQVGHHRNNVILDITKVQADVHARSDLVVLVAPFRESLQNVCFAAEEPHQTHDVLSDVANLAQKLVHVVGTSDENFVLNLVRIALNLAYDRRERINNVVAVSVISKSDIRQWTDRNLHQSVANPVTTKGDIVLQSCDPLSDMRRMRVGGIAEAQSPLAEYHNVDVEGGVFGLARVFVCFEVKRPETSKVVRRE
jgi:hypothetical protein